MLPPVPGVLRERVASVMVVRLAGGRTGVRTDGEAVWLTPRPAWEQIPSTVRSITFTAQGSTASGRSGRVSAPRTLAGDVVQRVVGFINALDLVQPGAVACPMGRNELLRLTFRAADGSVLARAVEHPTGCASVTLSVGGRTGPALNDFPTVTSELVRLGVIPTCTGRQLRVAANPLGRDPGGDVLTLTFTNRSDAVCRMTGFAGLRLIDGRGHRLRMTLRHVGTAAVVALYPGEAAWASATSTRCNAPRGAPGSGCAASHLGRVHAPRRVRAQAVRAVPRPDQPQRVEPGALKVITPRIRERLEREYPAPADLVAARELIERIPAELAVWREVSEGDRVEAAALTVAAGDLGKLKEAVELALLDWRDLLVAAEYV